MLIFVSNVIMSWHAFCYVIFVPSIVMLDMGETIVLFMCCDNIIVSKIVACNLGTVEWYCILRAL